MPSVAARPRTLRNTESKSFLVATISEVAEFFGVGVSAVNQWRSEADPMPGSTGQYDLAAIAKWTRGRGRPSSVLSDELKAADIRLKTAQARSKELDNEIASGDLLDRADVELWASTALIEAREMVMSLPEMLATSSPPELREFVRTESDRHCRDVLVALRRRLESDSIASDAAPTSAAESEVG